MKILITGGSGMVGRNLSRYLQAESFQLHAPNRGELDLRNRSAVEAYINELRPDLIIHAAGRVGGIQANISTPYDFLIENLEIGSNVISAAVNAGIPRLLNLGSSCIYPRDRDELLTEDLILQGPLEPTNEGYAIAKIAALRLCEYASRQNPNLSYKTLIPCNLYGPFDKFDPHHAHLIPAIINKVASAAKDGTATVEIWGDGTARREFMFVEDLCKIVATAINRWESLEPVTNVGLGYDYSVLEYYEAVASVIGWAGQFTFDTTKPVGMRRKVVDISRLQKWYSNPKTPLDQGITRTYQYFSEMT